jgi:hypothetical protein
MSFSGLAAWQAWALIAAAAGAAIALFLIKVRPPRIAVPSLLLWRRVFDQARHLTWWERVRRAISLAATAVIAIALALAIARPGPRVTAQSRGRTLIVIDSSWSMLARTSNGDTRWARALAGARTLVESSGGDAVALATTADGLVEGPTPDTALLETAIGRLTPSGGEDAGLPHVSGVDTVHFFTDGAVARPIDASVVVHSVFEPAGNVAITAFNERPPTARGTRAEAYLEIANYAATDQSVQLTLTRGTAVLFDRPVDAKAGEILRQIVPLDAAGDPLLRARIRAKTNALEADDEAVAWMGDNAPLAVTVVSENPGALQTVMQRNPGVQATFVKPAQYTPESGDVVVFDRWLPVQPAVRPALYLAPASASWLGVAGDEERSPRWSLVGDHAVLAGVDPMTVDIKRAHAYRIDGGRAVASSERGTPLVTIVESGDRRAVVLGFAIADSNLAAAPAFPVLIANAVDWLARPATSALNRPGRIVLPAGTARVTGPDGRAVPILPAGDRSVATLPTPGVYRVDGAGAHSVITVNVGGPATSNLTRTTLAPERAANVVAEAGGRPWWLYAIAVAFGLVALEWITWQRRITV